uniref:Ras-related protein Rab-18 n=1 Tax=Macrostomum lignano TaxID=282301 RepID=A0A1I8H8K8_9PLAT
DDCSGSSSDFDTDVEQRRKQGGGIPLADELAAAAPPARRTRQRRHRHSRSSRSRRHRLPSRSASSAVVAESDYFDMASDVAERQPERLFKIVTAGDAAVGKTSFVSCFCDDSCPTATVTTVGVDFRTRTLAVDDHVIAIQLWDTAGQERFRSLAKSYFRRADGALLIYDCTDEGSFVGVRDWLLEIRESSNSEIPVMLVAN